MPLFATIDYFSQREVLQLNVRRTCQGELNNGIASENIDDDAVIKVLE
jgi:hypothetical protein